MTAASQPVGGDIRLTALNVAPLGQWHPPQGRLWRTLHAAEAAQTTATQWSRAADSEEIHSLALDDFDAGQEESMHLVGSGQVRASREISREVVLLLFADLLRLPPFFCPSLLSLFLSD